MARKEKKTKPGVRGPNRTAPVNAISELPIDEAALFLQIPKSQLEREYKAKEWDGAYKLRGDQPYFIVHLIMERQRQQALRSLELRRV